MKFNFVKPTIIFSIVGLFIPGFTVILLIGLQILLSSFGLECSRAWAAIWITTTISGLILPFLFYRYLKFLKSINSPALKTRLTLFNLAEYIFIQSSLAALFTSGQTLCYVSDGQNGIEFVFTAWMALPLLVAISYIFNHTIIFHKEEKEVPAKSI